MRNTKNYSTPTLAIDGVHELTEGDLDAVSGGFEFVEHGTLGSSPEDHQVDAVIAKAVGHILSNMKIP